jgi:thiol-disulfide isomerase/thioredoxin
MTRWLVLAIALMAPIPCMTGAAVAGDLHPFGRGSWQEIRHLHAGRPMVVHFWGVTCGPCRVEMPNWGKLLAERPGLDLVMVNADLVPDEPGAVNALLAKSGLTRAESWIFADDFVERLRYEIDPRWQGEIPLTLLVARDGTTTSIEGVADLAAIRNWLDGQRPAP